MTILNPLASSNLVVQATVTPARPEERQNDLRVDQIVRATVVEGGLDRTMLELKHQRFWIKADRELQTGQQLELQVLTTHPKLSFKLLAASLDTRLAALLPLLVKPYNWSGLLQQIQQGSTQHSEPMQQVLTQIAAFLRPEGELSARDFSAVASTLNQLKSFEALFSGAKGLPLAATIDRLLTALNGRADTVDLPQQLKRIVSQLQQNPEPMRDFKSADREKIVGLLTQINQPQKPLQPEQARLLATELKTLLLAKPIALPRVLGRAVQELQLLLSPPASENIELSPKLLGHLKGLATQLDTAVAAKPDWPQNLRHLVQQILGVLQPLVAEPEILARKGNLGVLSQLLGLNLEAELLRGRTRDALSSLKLALLGESSELGVKGEEALHRIELFQLCRVRLAEQGLTFVPLPLSFLEEGFLIAEDDAKQAQQQKKAKGMRVSVFLRLSSLGNLRIDLLSEDSSCLLRVACEDKQRADFLQSMGEQLQERLQELSISSINFTVGVEAPARELLKKILPDKHGMLDARV